MLNEKRTSGSSVIRSNPSLQLLRTSLEPKECRFLAKSDPWAEHPICGSDRRMLLMRKDEPLRDYDDIALNRLFSYRNWRLRLHPT